MQPRAESEESRKQFVAVIGNRNAGKSTVIASLTGCRNRSFRGTVTDESRNESKSMYVIASSPEEKRLTLEELQEILTQVIQTDNCRALIMAIQPTRPTRRLSLEAIIEEVQNSNAFEPYLFVLEPGRNDPAEAQGILHEVNQRLGNTGLVAQELHGRRFAFLNARQVNQASQLFMERN